MGFLDFLSGGGSGIISSIFGGGMGMISAGKQIQAQKEMQERAFQQANEMAEKQNQWEIDRMGLQLDMNKNAARYSQDLAKEMWEYTGYKNQIKQMKEAGVNPALMYGGGGGGGQTTSGGNASGVSAITPMGLSVALQAKQQAAQIELTNAQTAKLKAETLKESSVGMAQGALDLVSTMIQNKANKTNTAKAEAEINNIRDTNNLIQENLGKLKSENKLLEFETWLNDLKKKAGHILDNGAEVTFEKLFQEKEVQGLLTELKELGVRRDKAEYDNQEIVSLLDNLEEIVQGKVDGFRINTKKYEQMEWELMNDKAFGDVLNSLGADSKFSKLILAIIRYFANKK